MERRQAEADFLIEGLDDKEVQAFKHPLFCMAVTMFVPGPTCKAALAMGVARTACEATEKTILQYGEQ